MVLPKAPPAHAHIISTSTKALTAQPARRKMRPGATPRETRRQAGCRRRSRWGQAIRFQFRAGVVYRGSIPIKAQRRSGQTHNLFRTRVGGGRAIISGRDAVGAPPQPCSFLALYAHKLPNADRLVVIDLPAPVSSFDQIAMDGHILRLAQSPKLPDPFLFDDTANYVEAKVWLSFHPWRMAGHGSFKTASSKRTWATMPLADLLVMILGYPECHYQRPSHGLRPRITGTVLFQPLKFQRNEKSRVVFALANHPRLISQPYEYATIERGKKIIVHAPSNGAKLEISRRAWWFTAARSEEHQR